MGLVRLADGWWLVLICCERKILLGGWWLLAGAELVWEKNTASWLGASQPNKAPWSRRLPLSFNAPIIDKRRVPNIHPVRLSYFLAMEQYFSLTTFQYKHQHKRTGWLKMPHDPTPWELIETSGTHWKSMDPLVIKDDQETINLAP
jgi:hypothetical protein